MCGYSVDVLEFIDFEHSPKNILIRAKRTTKITDTKRKAISSQILSLAKEFNATLELERQVNKNNRILDVEDKRFSIVVGKASMLLKDAFSIRNQVFCVEQNYKSGAGRDKYDETSWFTNVYFDSKVVSTSRLAQLYDGRLLLGKIAVLPEFRKCGLGKEMISSLIDIAREGKTDTVFVNAQSDAVEFYKKLGFDVCGQAYSDENKMLIPMSLKI